MQVTTEAHLELSHAPFIFKQAVAERRIIFTPLHESQQAEKDSAIELRTVLPSFLSLDARRAECVRTGRHCMWLSISVQSINLNRNRLISHYTSPIEPGRIAAAEVHLT